MLTPDEDFDAWEVPTSVWLLEPPKKSDFKVALLSGAEDGAGLVSLEDRDPKKTDDQKPPVLVPICELENIMVEDSSRDALIASLWLVSMVTVLTRSDGVIARSDVVGISKTELRTIEFNTDPLADSFADSAIEDASELNCSPLEPGRSEETLTEVVSPGVVACIVVLAAEEGTGCDVLSPELYASGADAERDMDSAEVEGTMLILPGCVTEDP